MNKVTSFCILGLMSVAFCTPISTLASGPKRDVPFKTGEKMTFRVRWLFVPAGEATIELLPIADFNGDNAYHFLLTARTNEFADIFYKVHDRIESYTDLNMTHSIFYKRRHRAGSKKQVNVNFDWEKRQAQYVRLDKREKRAPISIPTGTFDPLSVFFAFRLHNLSERKEITIPVTDGKKMVRGRLKVVKREEVTVDKIAYDTFLVEPELKEIGGVFEKSKDAKLQIWVTADSRRIPVIIRSKVAVGSFVAELKSYDPGIEVE
jgi:hypothetical protein